MRRQPAGIRREVDFTNFALRPEKDVLGLEIGPLDSVGNRGIRGASPAPVQVPREGDTIIALVRTYVYQSLFIRPQEFQAPIDNAVCRSCR
jgi:hypothetical protein